MPSFTIHTKLDTEKLDDIQKGLAKRIKTTTAKAADDMVEDIRAHWSGTYPPSSSPGQSPAVRSGNLDESIRAQAIDDGYTQMISPDLQKAPYGLFLEEGTVNMAARPYILPALLRMQRRFRSYFFDIFK